MLNRACTFYQRKKMYAHAYLETTMVARPYSMLLFYFGEDSCYLQI